jgi:hypothetical protein
MNTLRASPVMPGMKFHRQNGLPDAPAGQQDHTTGTPVRRRCWRPRRRRDREDAWQGPDTGVARDQTAPTQTAPTQTAPTQTAPTQTVPVDTVPVDTVPVDTVGASATSGGTIPGDMVVSSMQLAIGLLTASLDSAELQAWAVEALTPNDADGLCDVMAGLHMVCELMLYELHEATGEPPSATLQRLAMLAEHRRGKPSSS